MQNSLRVAGTATEDTAGVTRELFDVAARTRTPIGAMADLYRSAGLAASELGVSQQQVMELTARSSLSARDGAARGEAELRRLGIDLSKLTAAELERLDVFAGAWPDDGTVVNAAAIYAVLGK